MDSYEKSYNRWPSTCHGRWIDKKYKNGLVSVIIPTYNRGHLLTTTMDSVWNQTYRPIEMIVVDDGSEDNTAEIVDEWRKKLENGKQFQCTFLRQKNSGAPAARNLGAIYSHGEYLHFWDCEDIMHKEKLEKQVQVAQASKADAVLCDVQFFDETIGDMQNGFKFGTNISTNGDLKEPVKAYVSNKGWNTLSVLLHHNTAYKAGPWEETLKRRQDFEFFSRVAACSRTIKGIAEILSFERTHNDPDCISKRCSREVFESMIDAVLSVEKTFIIVNKLNAKARLFLSKQLMTIAVMAVQEQLKETAIKACQRAIELSDYPARSCYLKTYLYLIKYGGSKSILSLTKTGQSLNSLAHSIRLKRAKFD